MTYLLLRQAPDSHTQQVVKVRDGRCRLAATATGLVVVLVVTVLFLDDVLGLATCFGFSHLGERPEVLLAELSHDVCLASVRDNELSVDDHLHEARLIVQLVKLRLELIGEEVLANMRCLATVALL